MGRSRSAGDDTVFMEFKPLSNRADAPVGVMSGYMTVWVTQKNLKKHCCEFQDNKMKT